MSRIGKAPINVPSGVDIKVDGQNVTVKGPKGELSRVIPDPITVSVDDGTISVIRPDDHRDNDKQDPRRPGIGLEERQGEGKKSRHFPSVATARGGSIASEIVHGTARRASVNSQRKTAHECSTHRPDIRLWLPSMSRGYDALGSGVVASVTAGSGSDFFEVSVWGCEPAALEPVDVPWCPPGPAPAPLV